MFIYIFVCILLTLFPPLSMIVTLISLGHFLISFNNSKHNREIEELHHLFKYMISIWLTNCSPMTSLNLNLAVNESRLSHAKRFWGHSTIQVNDRGWLRNCTIHLLTLWFALSSPPPLISYCETPQGTNTDICVSLYITI